MPRKPEFDPRHHRSLLDRSELDFLGDLKGEHVPILNSLEQEAEEFGDDGLRRYCERYSAKLTSIGGKRAILTAQVAIQDEALKDAAEERRLMKHRDRRREGPERPEV